VADAASHQTRRHRHGDRRDAVSHHATLPRALVTQSFMTTFLRQLYGATRVPKLGHSDCSGTMAHGTFSKGLSMVATYFVAFFAAGFAVSSLLTWVYAVDHIDPPADVGKPAQVDAKAAA
jgi:hypothetical protein